MGLHIITTDKRKLTMNTVFSCTQIPGILAHYARSFEIMLNFNVRVFPQKGHCKNTQIPGILAHRRNLVVDVLGKEVRWYAKR